MCKYADHKEECRTKIKEIEEFHVLEKVKLKALQINADTIKDKGGDLKNKLKERKRNTTES